MPGKLEVSGTVNVRVGDVLRDMARLMEVCEECLDLVPEWHREPKRRLTKRMRKLHRRLMEHARLELDHG